MLAIISCSLRFIQGFLAIIATFLLIVTSDDVIEIVLNFAAVNFISNLDEVGFELAKWGKYGPVMGTIYLSCLDAIVTIRVIIVYSTLHSSSSNLIFLYMTAVR